MPDSNIIQIDQNLFETKLEITSEFLRTFGFVLR